MNHRSFSSPRRSLIAGLILITPCFGVDLDLLTIGNGANLPDAGGFGAVSYEYKISKSETTIAQYAEFLNKVAKTDTNFLYSDNMTINLVNGIERTGSSGTYVYTVSPGSGNKPITWVSWFDAARFANWMHNGQPTGEQGPLTTENGAYTLNGATSGISFTKNLDATFWIPSESEWYKAAYYDPNKGGIGGYWAQANQSDSLSGNTIGNAGSANYFDGDYVGSGTSALPTSNALTEAGAYGLNSDSAYGTNDQGGNVWELTDGVVVVGLDSYRVLRGGAWDSNAAGLTSLSFDDYLPTAQGSNVGFRLASVVPEPSAFLLTLLSVGASLARRRR